MPDIPPIDYASTPSTAAADRAAVRSFYLGIGTLIAGAFVIAIFMIRKRLGENNGILPLLVLPCMLIGHVCGSIEAFRALAGNTTRKSRATAGLLINGIMMGILGVLVLLFIIGIGVWAGMGR